MQSRKIGRGIFLPPNHAFNLRYDGKTSLTKRLGNQPHMRDYGRWLLLADTTSASATGERRTGWHYVETAVRHPSLLEANVLDGRLTSLFYIKPRHRVGDLVWVKEKGKMSRSGRRMVAEVIGVCILPEADFTGKPKPYTAPFIFVWEIGLKLVEKEHDFDA